jgi:HAD superfamily hydrolase (TIGR01549 family)
MSQFIHNHEESVLGSETKVVLFDLWKTLVTSHCKEPVWNLQGIIEHRVKQSDSGRVEIDTDDRFLEHCLTTNITDPDAFLEHAASKFNGIVRPNALTEFLKVLRGESMCTAVFGDVFETLTALRAKGYRLGVVSNAWAFPFEHIFERINFNGVTLGSFFEHIIGSYEVGFRKPEPQIFIEAARRFGVAPEDCFFVGDNLEADVRGAARVGMRPALIDRPGEFSLADIRDIPGAVYLHDLRQLVAA